MWSRAQSCTAMWKWSYLKEILDLLLLDSDIINLLECLGALTLAFCQIILDATKL